MQCWPLLPFGPCGQYGQDAVKNFPAIRKKAESGSPANFRECPLLRDEPPFLPGTSRPLETLLSLFDIYFSDRLPGATAADSSG